MITWTQALADAARAIAVDPYAPDGLSTDLRDRAREMAAKAVVGQTLAPHQVAFVQALRSRLSGLATHLAFEVAFGDAWEAAKRPHRFWVTFWPWGVKTDEPDTVLATAKPYPDGARLQFYATAPGAGCSKNYSTPEQAVRELAEADLGRVVSIKAAD